MNHTDIARIVLAARIKGAPTRRNAPDSSGRLMRVLHLAGHSDDLWAFTLTDGHRDWCLETVTDQHGVEPVCQRLGRRLSARLSTLHGQAVEHFALRPVSP